MKLDIIYNQDNSIILKELPDKSIDMILEDMPYGISNCKFDYTVNLENYWKERLRVIKDNGVIALTGVQPMVSEIILSQKKLFKYDLVWDKVGATGFLNAKKQPLRKHEIVIIFSKGTPIYNAQKIAGKPYTKTRHKAAEAYGKCKPYTYNNEGLLNPSSILVFPKPSCIGSNADRKINSIHPTQKPVELFSWLIKTYTNEGDIVFDGYMGSGTTAISCININRHYIGAELDTEYYSSICKRIEKNKLLLFNQ